MKKEDIKRYLKDYSIYNSRRSTINNAFASALSIADSYDEVKINAALNILGQNPHNNLLCAYCGNLAQTWDHIKCIVKKNEFSGNGHTLNNLIPCCKKCNSELKRNLDWSVFLQNENLDNPDRVARIEQYIAQNSADILTILKSECEIEMNEFRKIKEQVLALMIKGDEQAKVIREKVVNKLKSY